MLCHELVTTVCHLKNKTLQAKILVDGEGKQEKQLTLLVGKSLAWKHFSSSKGG